MAKKFKELTKDFSPERRDRIEAQKAKLREEMNLAELRQALSLTQNTLAEALGVGQAEISKIENRADVFVSTLRNFLTAMGGELEIRAVFPDHTVTIKNFSSLVTEQEEKRTRVITEPFSQ
jgi:transcriptional regulator with XRE-family HTH domain